MVLDSLVIKKYWKEKLFKQLLIVWGNNKKCHCCRSLLLLVLLLYHVRFICNVSIRNKQTRDGDTATVTGVFINLQARINNQKDGRRNFWYCSCCCHCFFTFWWYADAIDGLMQLVCNNDWMYPLFKLIKIVQACSWRLIVVLLLVLKKSRKFISYNCIHISACRDLFWTPKRCEWHRIEFPFDWYEWSIDLIKLKDRNKRSQTGGCNFENLRDRYCCCCCYYFFPFWRYADVVDGLMQPVGNDDWMYPLFKLIKIVQACSWIPLWSLGLIQKIISVPISYTCSSISACRDPFWTPKWCE